jgi:alpha-tubulin suppressor-like RCC1 family protein
MFSLLRLNYTKNLNLNIKNSLHSSSFLNKELNESLKSKYKNTPVYTFAQKPRNSNRTGIKDRIFVWGYAGTGALGEASFLQPKGKVENPKYNQRKPWRLKWTDNVDADPIHVACGNGFSLIATSNTQDLKGHHLFGTGMNTDSQIGVHETKSGDKLKYLIEPAIIDLPFERSSDKKLKILDITCGRAHSIVLTNFGVISFGNNAYGQ